jgi:hypothetical protein
MMNQRRLGAFFFMVSKRRKQLAATCNHPVLRGKRVTKATETPEQRFFKWKGKHAAHGAVHHLALYEHRLHL